LARGVSLGGEFGRAVLRVACCVGRWVVERWYVGCPGWRRGPRRRLLGPRQPTRIHPQVFDSSLTSGIVAAKALLAILITICPLVGCRPATGPGQPTRLRMAHVYEVKAPTHAFGTAHLAERLRATNVGLDTTVFPASQLGNEAELLEQLVAGELELAITGPSFLGMWHPPIGAFDAAYAFRDLDHVLEVADSELMQPLWDELRERYGIRVLDTWIYGARHITANRPIRHPDDLRGFRLRLPGARVFQITGDSLGASPMPIAFSEVYMALQQGIADGQENPIPTIQAMGFHEVQKYLILTGHIQSSVHVLVNERVWQRLLPEQQEALRMTIRQLGREVHEGTLKQEAEILSEWRKTGTLEVIDDVDVDAFRAKARAYFASGFPFSELYEQISSEFPERLPSEREVP
jgi:TRAP-type transport system periplasmic protein